MQVIDNDILATLFNILCDRTKTQITRKAAPIRNIPGFVSLLKAFSKKYQKKRH